MAKLTQEDILAYLEEATILELNDLVSAIEEKFGVVAAAAVAAAPVEEAAAAGPSEVTVTLTDVGGTKVAVIKAVREITGLGLVDAKKLVDGAQLLLKKTLAQKKQNRSKKNWLLLVLLLKLSNLTKTKHVRKSLYLKQIRAFLFES